MKSRKTVLSVIALTLSLMLIVSGCTYTGAPAQTEAPINPATEAPAETAEVTADPLENYDVVGPWGLSKSKNDIPSLYNVFGSMLRDCGASMELKSNGEISYSVGSAGGAGTYERTGNVIAAQITNYNEGTQEPLELTLTEDAGQIYLTATVYDTLLWWTQAEDDISASPATVADVSAYDSLLELYRTALTEKYDDMKLTDSGLNYMLMFYYEKDPLASIGYCFNDLDGDGTPELLISAISGDEFYTAMVFDAYTLVNGVPTQLFSSVERNRYYLLTDGSFYNEGAMSAAESVYRQLRVSNGTLAEDAQLYYNGASADGVFWKVGYNGGALESISETDANAMISSWQSLMTKAVYIPFAG